MIDSKAKIFFILAAAVAAVQMILGIAVSGFSSSAQYFWMMFLWMMLFCVGVIFQSRKHKKER